MVLLWSLAGQMEDLGMCAHFFKNACPATQAGLEGGYLTKRLTKFSAARPAV
jgi:hypothetical protein